VTGVRTRRLWRAAAIAALISFLWLPRGHLSGHDEVASARAHQHAGAGAVSAAPLEAPGSERAAGCPLCLSLSKVRTSLAAPSGAPASAPAAASPLATARSVPVRETFVSAHTAPRAPPSA
jgi:hypothetical protein